MLFKGNNLYIKLLKTCNNRKNEKSKVKKIAKKLYDVNWQETVTAFFKLRETSSILAESYFGFAPQSHDLKSMIFFYFWIQLLVLIRCDIC